MTDKKKKKAPRLIHLRRDDDIFMSRLGPDDLFGDDYHHWGYVREYGRVCERRTVPLGAHFRASMEFRAFEDVFLRGKRWEETEFYNHIVNRHILKGKALWRCDTPEKFLRRLNEDVTTIYRNMRRYGYLSQKELLRKGLGKRKSEQEDDFSRFNRSGYGSKISENHEIKVGLNETGTLVFLDGRHRLGIAMIAGIERIPACVLFRQRSWHEFRKTVRGLSKAGGSGPRLRIEHPDLARFPVPETAAREVEEALQARGMTGIRLREVAPD